MHYKYLFTGVFMHDISALDRRSQVTRVISNETGIDQTMIERMVRTFYTPVREDARLGPVFAVRIADWEPHLARMCDFWSSIIPKSQSISCNAPGTLPVVPNWETLRSTA